MDDDEKFDLILKKLEQNEKKLKDLEKKTKNEEKEIESEEKEVNDASSQKDKLNVILEKLENTDKKLRELENKTRESAEFTQGGVERFLSRKNDFLKINNGLLILIVMVTVAAVILYAWFGGFLQAPSAQTITTSGQYFLGPVGSSLGSQYTTGLSNLSSQLQSVAQQQLAGKIQCNAPSSSSPGFCVLIMQNSDYDIIPMRVPANFSAPSISQGGKLTFVYIGAQGCPYCAQERWAFTIALSQFGNFSNLFYDTSATNDGSVPTILFNFSSSLYNEYAAKPPLYSNGVAVAPYGDQYSTPLFQGAYYTSNYINFLPFDEVMSSFWLNTSGIPASITNSVVLPAQQGFGIKDFTFGGVPFFDINNNYIFDGATVAPMLFGQVSTVPAQYSTHKDILSSIQNPQTDSFGETALGAANIMIAQICTLLNNTAPVCQHTYVQQLQTMLSNSTY